MSQALPHGDQKYSEAINQLAYQLWQARGCPIGDPMTDWYEAEKKIKASTTSTTSTGLSVPAGSQTGQTGSQIRSQGQQIRSKYKK